MNTRSKKILSAAALTIAVCSGANGSDTLVGGPPGKKEGKEDCLDSLRTKHNGCLGGDDDLLVVISAADKSTCDLMCKANKLMSQLLGKPVF